MIRFAFLLAALLAATPLSASFTEDDLLPIDEAFALTASADDTDVRLHWHIADGYYLYRHRIALKSLSEGVRIGEPQLPDGRRHRDEFFGDVETYRGELAASATIEAWPASIAQAQFEVRYQGCADVGVCYPPHRVTVDLPRPAGLTITPAALAAPVDAPSIDNPLARALATPAAAAPLLGEPATLSINPGAGSEPVLQDPLPAEREPPLPEEQAFVFEAIAWSPTQVLARFSLPKNYYLYRGAGVAAAAAARR